MSETSENMVTLHLTQHQAEALFCILRLELNDHNISNNNNSLSFTTFTNDEMDEEEFDKAANMEEEEEVNFYNTTRLCAAWQLFNQLPDEVKKLHGSYSLVGGKKYPAIQNGETYDQLPKAEG